MIFKLSINAIGWDEINKELTRYVTSLYNNNEIL